MVVYKISCLLSNKLYIGITQGKPKRRWQQHINHGHGIIGRAIKTYGKENFVFEVIDSASTINDLKQKEIEWIAKLNTRTPNGYNVLIGGQLHDAWNKGIKGGKPNKGSWTSEQCSGANNPFYGKKHTEETKAKVRAKQKEWEKTDKYQEWLLRMKENYNKNAKIVNERFEKARKDPQCKEKIARSRGLSNIEVYDFQGNLLASNVCRQEISTKFDFDYALLCYYLRNKRYVFKGFIVKFENDPVNVSEIIKNKDVKVKKTFTRPNQTGGSSEIENITTGELYIDVRDAANKLNVHVKTVQTILIGKAGTCKGCILEYKAHPRKLEYRAIREQKRKKPQKRQIICVETGERFNSIRSASDELKIHRRSINNNLRGWSQSAGGLTFKYINDNL